MYVSLYQWISPFSTCENVLIHRCLISAHVHAHPLCDWLREWQTVIEMLNNAWEQHQQCRLMQSNRTEAILKLWSDMWQIYFQLKLYVHMYLHTRTHTHQLRLDFAMTICLMLSRLYACFYIFCFVLNNHFLTEAFTNTFHNTYKFPCVAKTQFIHIHIRMHKATNDLYLLKLYPFVN